MRSVSIFFLRIATAIAWLASAPPVPTWGRRRDGSDWPRFLGPTSNGVSTEKGILTKWPREGLKVLWEAPMGLGFLRSGRQPGPAVPLRPLRRRRSPHVPQCGDRQAALEVRIPDALRRSVWLQPRAASRPDGGRRSRLHLRSRRNARIVVNVTDGKSIGRSTRRRSTTSPELLRRRQRSRDRGRSS